jgi:CheY-like chemotaxis protein
VLEKHGFSVTVVVDGVAAVAAVAQGHFDLVLMDIEMPLMDGLQATTAIRQTEQIAGGHTPIIAMTAHAMKGDQERCLASGMDGYISKPIRTAELLAAAQELAGRTPGGPTVNADGMTRLAHDFLVNTTPVQLRSRDFATQTDTASWGLHRTGQQVSSTCKPARWTPLLLTKRASFGRDSETRTGKVRQGNLGQSRWTVLTS